MITIMARATSKDWESHYSENNVENLSDNCALSSKSCGSSKNSKGLQCQRHRSKWQWNRNLRAHSRERHEAQHKGDILNNRLFCP